LTPFPVISYVVIQSPDRIVATGLRDVVVDVDVKVEVFVVEVDVTVLDVEVDVAVTVVTVLVVTPGRRQEQTLDTLNAWFPQSVA